MVAVAISRSLRQDIGDAESIQLAENFRDYKAGLQAFGLVFGRDRQFVKPAEVVAEEIWHVHLEDNACISAWDYLTDNFVQRRFTQDNYTSDTILVYGQLWDVRRTPYLLQAILAPDGHDQMKSDLRMRAIAAEFADERRDFTVATSFSDWIIVE